MPYRIDLPPPVRKELDKLDKKTFLRIDQELVGLAVEPRPRGCKKIEGDIYRIRAGDWRIVYAVSDAARQVQIVRIVRRSERTYRRLP